MDWDYLRYIRALAIGGTLAKAGELLGVHQTTVLRRLDQMEESMGVQFFERSRDGLHLTPVGETAFREAERLAIEMENLERKLVGQDSAPVGKVRLAAEDAMMNALLSVRPRMKARGASSISPLLSRCMTCSAGSIS